MMNAGQQFTEKYLDVMFSTLKDATPEEVQEELERCRIINRKPVRVPHHFKKHFAETQFLAANGFNMQVFSTEPYHDTDSLILYLHGGACIYQPVFFHWRFLHDMAIRTHYSIVMPIYPKYPDFHCLDDMAVMLDFYERCIMPMKGRPLIHILAGENVCIHVITPTHLASLFAAFITASTSLLEFAVPL